MQHRKDQERGKIIVIFVVNDSLIFAVLLLLKKQPMIGIVFSFSIGILIAIFFSHVIPMEIGVGLLIAGVVSYIVLFFIKGKKPWGTLARVLGLSLIILSGWIKTAQFADTNDPHHLMNYKGKTEYYLAVVTKPAKEKEKTWQYEVSIQKSKDKNIWSPRSGKVLLYIAKDTSVVPFSYGQQLIIQGAPRTIRPPGNPHAFNFKQFLRFKNIYHQHFVQPQQVLLVASAVPNDIKYYAYAVQVWAVDKLKRYVPNIRAQAVAIALTLGVSDSIDNDLRKTYAASGAMHVLAVSGLHVGIIYGLLLLILIPLRSFAWGKWVITGVSLVVLWMYAFLTGLSPSVLRAVTMFSLLALAQLKGRNANIYSTLAGSAFILLFFNPYLITSVGFQLSYLAVFGIVSIHLPLYLIWEPRLAFWDRIWSITCVSMAAQLATFGLGMLYFHQLPVYFLIANLFVLPGALLVLAGSISVIITSIVPSVATLLGMVLQWVIQLLHQGLFIIENWPFSVIQNIYITPLQCILLLMIIFCAALLMLKKRYVYLIFMFVGASAFAASRWFYFHDEVLQKRLVVYAIPGHTGVEWIEAGTSYFYADKPLINNSKAIRFNILPNRLFCGVHTLQTNNLSKGNGIRLFYRGGKSMAIVNKHIEVFPKSLFINYLILENNAFTSLQDIKKVFQFDQLILGSSNTKYRCKQIMGKYKNKSIYSVPHQGAYVEYI